jgi:hypothetical protein
MPNRLPRQRTLPKESAALIKYRDGDCVRQALAARIPTYLVDDDQGVPKRLDACDKRLR